MQLKESIWVSPDGKIKKEIIRHGQFGKKPIENSKCDICVTEGPPELMQLTSVTIGQQDSNFGDILDICLTTMSKNEDSKFTVNADVKFRIQMVAFSEEKYIYQWSPEEKYTLVIKHKDAGVELYKNKQKKAAAYRFNKGLKILHSIPLDVEQVPVQVDTILVEDINKLKGTLYNNLASCYFKNGYWLLVIDFCQKALSYDSNNVKALYKLAVSYKNDKNYENSYAAFTRVLELEPNNKACGEHLKFVVAQMKESEKRVNDLVKNMFKDTVNA